jgi:transcriptional regulator with XRE-family HTH domain
MDRREGGKPLPGDSGPRREGLGRAIQALRAERGLKRQRLAQDAGLSYAYLAEIENAKKEPSTRVLDAIARALGIRLPELMEVAESLQTLVKEAKNDPRSLELARVPERSPLMARRLAAADRIWFHRSTEPARREEATPRKERAPEAAEVQSRTRTLNELQGLASRLSHEDLERVIDLARRLGR